MSRQIEVMRSGPLTTVQDLGRFGHRGAGVSPSGAADLGAMARANALVGNSHDAAVLEATFGGTVVRARSAMTVAAAGAVCAGVAMNTALELRAGETVSLDGARAGIRTYIAIGGGVGATQVLGSRSTDTLSGLGPAPLARGQLIPLGDPASDAAPPDGTPQELPGAWADLDVLRGPHDDWLPEEVWASLDERSWEVSPDSNRVAVRLRGASLPIREGALPPEPLVRGAMQVPPDGRPIVFLADHPVTGGYPVVGVLTPASCDVIAQCRPGSTLRLQVVPFS